MSESANDVTCTCTGTGATKRQRCDDLDENENDTESVSRSTVFSLSRNEEQFWKEFMEDLSTGGKGANFTDMEFICKDGSVPVHRWLLTSSLLSSSLKDLLLEKKEEISCVNFPDASVRHMKLALTFLYSGQCVFGKDEQVDICEILRYLGCLNSTQTIVCHHVVRGFGIQIQSGLINLIARSNNDSTIASGSSSSRPAPAECVNTESEQMNNEEEPSVESESVNVVAPSAKACELVDLTVMSDDEGDSANYMDAVTTTRMNPMNSPALFNTTQPLPTWGGQYANGLPKFSFYGPGRTQPAYILGLRKID